VDDAGVWQLVPGDGMVPVPIPLVHVMATERSKFVSTNTSPVQTKHGLYDDVNHKIQSQYLNYIYTCEVKRIKAEPIFMKLGMYIMATEPI
jgi:hypothetical protein